MVWAIFIQGIFWYGIFCHGSFWYGIFCPDTVLIARFILRVNFPNLAKLAIFKPRILRKKRITAQLSFYICAQFFSAQTMYFE